MEIKTLRCEICGKVYHSDEVETEMIIAVKEKGKESKSYECICPECTERMTDMIKQPNFISEVSARYNKAKNKLQKLIGSICGVYTSITGMYDMSPWYINEDVDIDIYTSKLKDISDVYFSKHSECEDMIDVYKSMKKSRDSWMGWCISFMIIGLGLFACLLFTR